MTEQLRFELESATTPGDSSRVGAPQPGDTGNTPRLGTSGIATVVIGVVYGLWCLALAVLVEGHLVHDAMKLRGVDMTNAEQISAAVQDPSLLSEVAALRAAGNYHWFTVRHASMSLLSLLAVVAVLRRWPTSSHWLALLAIAVPSSMLIAVVGAPLASMASGIGMILSCVVGSVGLWILWWFDRRRIRAASHSVVPGDWWLKSAAPIVSLAFIATFLVGWILERDSGKPIVPASNPVEARQGSVAVRPDYPPDWVVHRPTPTDVKQPTVLIATPAEWDLGDPGFGGSVFVALPPQLDSGNVVVRIASVPAGLDVWAESPESFRSGFLQSASSIYADMRIIHFSKGTLLTGQRCIDLSYSATNVAGTTTEGRMRLASCRGFLVTLHVEAYAIPEHLKSTLATVAMSMRIECR